MSAHFLVITNGAGLRRAVQKYRVQAVNEVKGDIRTVTLEGNRDGSIQVYEATESFDEIMEALEQAHDHGPPHNCGVDESAALPDEVPSDVSMDLYEDGFMDALGVIGQAVREARDGA